MKFRTVLRFQSVVKITATELENKLGLLAATQFRRQGFVVWQGVKYVRVAFQMPAGNRNPNP